MSYRDLILADVPALYWPLDSTYGATDQSGNSRNGTGGGSISIGGFAGSPISGETTSTDFDGSDDRITSAYATADGTWTFEVWVNRDATATTDVVWGATGSGASQIGFTAADNAFTNFGTLVSWTSVGVGTAAWHHLLWTLDTAADTAEFWVDSVSKGSQSFPDTISGKGNWLLGAVLTSSNPFDGKMAHAAIFARALTISEIQSHYQAGIGSGLAAGKTFIHQANRGQ